MALSWSKLQWKLRHLLRQIWVRVTAFAMLGLATAVAGVALQDAIPSDLSVRIGAESVGTILQILASSMLTVTTFSLSIMTAAYATAGSNASPRAVQLLIEDGTSQTVLATFMGAFVFSLVGIILLETGIFGESGGLILFAVTLLVVLIVVVSLLRWIARLGDLGRVEDSMVRVETNAFNALRDRLAQPWLGGQRMIGAPPVLARPLCSDRIGFLQHCDMDQLAQVAKDHGLHVYLAASSGDFVHPGQPLLHVLGLPADAGAQQDACDRLLAAHTIGRWRSYDQDPRQGLRILSEIGQRALSPAINDPGTAELVIRRLVRVLAQWSAPVQPELRYPAIWVPALDAGEMLQLAFADIARDGAGNYPLQAALQSGLLALAQISAEVFADEALTVSDIAMAYARAAIPISAQQARLQALSDQIADLARQAANQADASALPQYDQLAEKL